MLLTRGDKGREVELLQGNLFRLGLYKHKMDGRFGRHTREAVIAFQERYFCDGIVNKATAKAIDEAVEAWDRRELTILRTVPHGLEQVETEFGHIRYEDMCGGYILITNGWEARNIVHVDLPVVGTQAVHEKMVPVYTAVFNEIQKRGLDRLIEVFLCWSPRHQRHNTQLPLSTHSWAIACDINPSTNQPGTRGDMDPGIVDVFERHGFVWGGRWLHYRDSMHFEYCK